MEGRRTGERRGAQAEEAGPGPLAPSIAEEEEGVQVGAAKDIGEVTKRTNKAGGQRRSTSSVNGETVNGSAASGQRGHQCT